MKLAVLTFSVSLIAFAQTQNLPAEFDTAADHQVKVGSVLQLSGHVTFKTARFMIEADTVEFNQDNFEIVAGGNVVVTAPAAQFDTQADHQVMAAGTVHLRGHVAVRTTGLRLEAGEVDFTGDANKIVSKGSVRIQLK